VAPAPTGAADVAAGIDQEAVRLAVAVAEEEEQKNVLPATSITATSSGWDTKGPWIVGGMGVVILLLVVVVMSRKSRSTSMPSNHPEMVGSWL
jgi:hypothetical protein